MSFYIAARTSTVEDATGGFTNNPYRVMVSPFQEDKTYRDKALELKANDDKVNKDYIEALLDAIEKGEM